MSMNRAYTDFLGGDSTFYWKKWSIKEEHCNEDIMKSIIYKSLIRSSSNDEINCNARKLGVNLGRYIYNTLTGNDAEILLCILKT